MRCLFQTQETRLLLPLASVKLSLSSSFCGTAICFGVGLSKFSTAGDFLEGDQSSLKAAKSVFAIQEWGERDNIGYHGNPAASISAAALTLLWLPLLYKLPLLHQHPLLH